MPDDIVHRPAPQVGMGVAVGSDFHTTGTHYLDLSPRHVPGTLLVHRFGDDEESAHEAIFLEQGVGVSIVVLVAIIKGQDELWDVSLLKFIYEITRSSMPANIGQMQARGLLNIDASGVPADVRLRIEESFKMVLHGELEPHELKDELDRWGLFEEYEDRFLSIFKGR